MANTVNKTLLNTILRKRRDSEPLNNEEEAYARKLFGEMMGSKKQVRKVVRIVTGEQLRKEQTLQKSKTDAEATRKDPRYPQGKNPQTIKGENTDPDVNRLKTKIPDADNAPKTGPHPGLEGDRLGSMTQEAVPPRSEAVKFVSADPAKVGDIVSKNMAKEGTHIVKGIVLNIKDGVAFVKWANGRTMYEHAHLLVKVKKSEDAAAASEVKTDPKLGPSDAEEEAKNPPMKKDGDIAAAKDYSSPGRPETTPFEGLTSSLQDVVRLASQVKDKQEETDDQDVKDEYDQIVGQLRGVAETILSGLSSELAEAEAEYDNENE